MSGKLKKAIQAYQAERDRVRSPGGSWKEDEQVLTKEGELSFALVESLNAIQKEALKHLVSKHPLDESAVWPKVMRALLLPVRK